MELIDNFNTTLWHKGDANAQEGFLAMRIASRQAVDQKKGQYKYAVFDDNGDLKQVLLDGAGSADPLKGIGNIELKLSEDGKHVIGVQLDDEVVVFQGAQ